MTAVRRGETNIGVGAPARRRPRRRPPALLGLRLREDHLSSFIAPSPLDARPSPILRRRQPERCTRSRHHTARGRPRVAGGGRGWPPGRLLGAGQVRAPVVAGQLEGPSVEGDAGGTVAERSLGGEGFDHLLGPGTGPGTPQAADALHPEREAHGAVDALKHPRQLLLTLDEHDAADARRPARDALRDAHDLRSALPIPDPDAVVSGAELVPHVPHLSPYAQASEGAKRQGGGLVVAFADAAPSLYLM